jgi:hypothetical protein
MRATHYATEPDAIVVRAADGLVLARFHLNTGDVRGTWRLVEVAGRPVSASIELWLRGGKMKGVSRCHVDKVQLGDGMVVLSPPSSAVRRECRIAGSPKDRTPEAVPGLPRALAEAKRYEVSGDELTFFDDSRKIMVWRRAWPTAR